MSHKTLDIDVRSAAPQAPGEGVLDCAVDAQGRGSVAAGIGVPQGSVKRDTAAVAILPRQLAARARQHAVRTKLRAQHLAPVAITELELASCRQGLPHLSGALATARLQLQPERTGGVMPQVTCVKDFAVRQCPAQRWCSAPACRHFPR